MSPDSLAGEPSVVPAQVTDLDDSSGRHRFDTPFFSSTRGARRERTVSDLVVLLLTLVAATLTALVAVPPSGFEQAVIGLIEAVPSWLDFLWRVGIAVLIGWVLVLLYVAAVRRRVDVLVDMAIAAAFGLGLSIVAAQVLNGAWPDWSQILTGGAGGTVPLVAVVSAIAANYSAGAHLTAPYRRFGRVVILSGIACAVLLGATTPLGGILSILVGAASAALLHVLAGSSTGRPSLDEIAEALREFDIEVTGLTDAPRRSGGPQVADATDRRGHRVRVDVYGRDARDSQFLTRVWRSLWFRGAVPLARTRLNQVEHEGFVTLLAASRSLLVPEVVMAGRTGRGDALIVVRDESRPLAECDRVEVEDALGGLWELVAGLHAIGMIHGAFRPESFGLEDGNVTLRELGPVSLSSDEGARMRDLAQVVATTALLVGIEGAVVAAGEALGADRVERMLPYLQAAALSTSLRRDLKHGSVDVDALRSATGAVVDVEVPEPVRLRRVSPRSLIVAALLVLLGWMLINRLTSVNLSELWNEISGATPGWVIAGLLLAQLPFLAQAVATRGAAPVAVPLGPLTMLQASIGFVALAVPSTAGRLALDIRFFQRQGLPAASAVSISAIDSFGGFLVQISLLLLTLVFGVGDVNMSLHRSSGGSSVDLALVLGVLAGVAVLLGMFAVALPRIRARIIARVAPILGQVRSTAVALRSPSKLLQLFGGNLTNQLLFAVALGVCLRAFGGHLDLATLVVIYVAAALFGGLMPVPGGIGVMEGALMAGLVAAGIDTTTASATALLFRAVTFYLPPIWGWLALGWLRRRSYL